MVQSGNQFRWTAGNSISVRSLPHLNPKLNTISPSGSEISHKTTISDPLHAHRFSTSTSFLNPRSKFSVHRLKYSKSNSITFFLLVPAKYILFAHRADWRILSLPPHLSAISLSHKHRCQDHLSRLVGSEYAVVGSREVGKEFTPGAKPCTGCTKWKGVVTWAVVTVTSRVTLFQ